MKDMKEGIFTVSYPSPVADDGAIRACVTLEVTGGHTYTHNESVWKGLDCLGLIFGFKGTNVEGEDRQAALDAIAGLADILRNDYGMDIRDEEEIGRTALPAEE